MQPLQDLTPPPPSSSADGRGAREETVPPPPVGADRAGRAAFVINEVQLLLAEKRTSLSTLRTGIAVFALPVTVLSFLIVTSDHYDADRVILLLAPLLVISAALAVLGVYLIVRSVRRIGHYDYLITRLRSQSSVVNRLLR